MATETTANPTASETEPAVEETGGGVANSAAKQKEEIDVEGKIEINLTPVCGIKDRDCEGTELCIAEVRRFWRRWRAWTIVRVFFGMIKMVVRSKYGNGTSKGDAGSEGSSLIFSSCCAPAEYTSSNNAGEARCNGALLLHGPSAVFDIPLCQKRCVGVMHAEVV